MLKVLLSLFLCLSLLRAQTVIVPVPGERTPSPTPQTGGGGGASLGLVMGALFGLGITLVLSQLVKAKPQRPPRLAFVPFEYVAVYRGKLPEDIKTLEEESFDEYSLSLISWEEEEEKIREKLEGRVIALERNWLYEVYGEVREVKITHTLREKGVVAVLDTGVDRKLLGDAIFFERSMRRDAYTPEEHGTAVAYLVNTQRGARVALYRVCSGNLCDGWSISKALVDIHRKGINTINMSFGTEREDRVVGFVLKRLLDLGYKVVAPAGNRPMEDLPFPARLEGVLSVAGAPCFPQPQCKRAKAREAYTNIQTPLGSLTGTSFSSAIHAGKLSP